MNVENPTTRLRRIFDEDVEIAALAEDPSDEADGLGPDEALTLDETLALPVGNEAVEVAPVLLTATLPVRS
jgi:hypothetical protein